MSRNQTSWALLFCFAVSVPSGGKVLILKTLYKSSSMTSFKYQTVQIQIVCYSKLIIHEITISMHHSITNMPCLPCNQSWLKRLKDPISSLGMAIQKSDEHFRILNLLYTVVWVRKIALKNCQLHRPIFWKEYILGC